MTTETQSPVAKTLATQIEFTYNVFQTNTTGIDHATSLKQPGDSGNCINWIGGHILAARQTLMLLFDQPEIWDLDARKRYGRGSDPILREGEGRNWDEIVAEFAKSQDQVRAGFAAATPEMLAAPLPPDRNPFELENAGQMVAGLCFHEAYHVGQLGLARRLIGLDSAIG